MITLGKEQPLGLEVQEVFNPSTVQMMLNAQQNYVNAMRDDYLRGVKRLDDFQKEYGDFYSPIDKDNENWYNMTQKPINDLIKKYGPDIIRSQEGRAMIESVIRNTDYGSLSKLKASAQYGTPYLKMLGELRAKGLYDKDFQHWVNQRNGVQDFENWDTLRDGVFQKTSPDIYADMNQLTTKWYDNSQPLYKGMKNGSRVYSLDFNDLKNIAQTHAEGFVETPRGAYELQKIQKSLIKQNPNMSQDELTAKSYDALNDMVARSNLEWLRPEKYEADPFALQAYKASLDEAATIRAERRAAQRQQMQLQQGQQTGPYQYNTRFNFNSNQNFVDKTLNGQNQIKSMLKIQQYWINRLANAKTPAEKKYAKDHLNWWKGSETWDMKKLVKNGIITIDQNGVITPTTRFTNAYQYSNSTDMNINPKAGNYSQQLTQAAKQLYSVFQQPVSGVNKTEHDTWGSVLMGSTELHDMPGTSNKYKMTALNSKGLRYAPIRQANVTGTKVYRYNNIQRQFDRWLRSDGSGNGYLVNTNLSTAQIPKSNRAGMSVDVQGNISITNEQFKRFCAKHGYTDLRDTAAKLGLGVYDYTTKNSKTSNASKEEKGRHTRNEKYVNTYYTIPMIRTVNNNGGFFWRDFNTVMNDKEYGANNAYKESVNAEAASLMDR